MCVLLLARAAAGCAGAKMVAGGIAFFAFPKMSNVLNKLLLVAMSDQFDYDRTTCARAPLVARFFFLSRHATRATTAVTRATCRGRVSERPSSF